MNKKLRIWCTIYTTKLYENSCKFNNFKCNYINYSIIVILNVHKLFIAI